jgi:hypothetical protein
LHDVAKAIVAVEVFLYVSVPFATERRWEHKPAATLLQQLFQQIMLIGHDIDRLPIL